MMTEKQHADKDEKGTIDEMLRKEVAADLEMHERDLDGDANLLKLGLDSLRLMAWIHRLRQRGYKIKLKDLYQQPTLKGWSRLLRRLSSEIIFPSTSSQQVVFPHCTWLSMRNEEPFALSPVQHAYLVGRSPTQTLGGVGCHLYQEFDGEGLDADALEHAVHALTERHPMLKVAFLEQGLQQYLHRTCWKGLCVHDMRSASPADVEAHLQTMRERNGHRVLAVENGENFDFQLTLLPDGHHRLHVDLDLLTLDAASFSLVFDELAALVRGEHLQPVNEDYDFRSYLAQAQQENETARHIAKQFWAKRMVSLPEAPRLPMACEPAQIKQVKISRQTVEIPPDDWAIFKIRSADCGVTPTMMLVTCFSAVMARWCSQPHLLLNVTLFDRQPLHPAVENMIGDFTNILLLDIACEGAHLDILAQANQQTFAEAYEHRHWSGVEMLRELRKTTELFPYGAPVVFTSNLGRPLFGQTVTQTLGLPGWGISQTPQVWIDHLVYEQGHSAYLQWDSNLALFPPGLIEEMFQAYVGLIELLIKQPQAWHETVPDLMPTEQKTIRERVNRDKENSPKGGLLSEKFWSQAQALPTSVALIHGESRLSYAQLAHWAKCCAKALVVNGVKQGDCVAISMSKGIGQIVAVLGVLYAGAMYVPVSLDQPLERRRAIYASSGSRIVMVCRNDVQPPELHEIVWFAWQDAFTQEPLVTPLQVTSDDPAYLIYTSGSTGMPKGVCISHGAALNTCDEINHRYSVSANDRLLGLSALHFDLSVYDIFGALSVGATLVLVDERQRRDPAAWCDIINQHGVTIWNTVPALFDMLLTYCEGFHLQAPAKLRVVMLSGDWIDIQLPGRYRNFRADGNFVAMGGATEASIWSNVYDVEEVSPDWRSIPYGYPLAHQKYRVVDIHGRDCPDWVPGELWIGGKGVALGYFNDPIRTEKHFIKEKGERWYRTGDVGCYWPDGRLEFLGRRDKQVKIGGYRIELGEIEAALLKVNGVRYAVALAVGEREKKLAAFIVTQGQNLYSTLPANPLLQNVHVALILPQERDPNSIDLTNEKEISRWVAGFLFEHLCRHGVDLTTDSRTEEILAEYGARPEWARLINKWLTHLCDEGFLDCSSTNSYSSTGRLPSSLKSPVEDQLCDIANELSAHDKPLAQILRGQRSAQTLLSHPFWSPEQLMLSMPETQEALESLAVTLRELANALGRPVRLHEVGARSSVAAACLLQRLDNSVVDYTGWDESQEMGLLALSNLQQFANARVQRWHDDVSPNELHHADMVWANNSLHRLGESGVGAILALSAPSALVCVFELRRMTSLALISAELLANNDKKELESRLHETLWWREWFGKHGIACEADGKIGNLQWLFLRAPGEVMCPDSARLATYLHDMLPDYMVPQRLVFIDAMPLTANGKVNHQALLQCLSSDKKITVVEPQSPLGDAEQFMASLWCELLNIDVTHRDSHFFQLGGDSLLATRLIGELGNRGFAGTLADLFNFPTLAGFAATVHRIAVHTQNTLQADPDNRFIPFTLTEVQQAYLVGRQPGLALSGVGSQFFVEFDVAVLDVARFEYVINRIIQRHDMLKAVVRDGMQQVLPKVPLFQLCCHQVTNLNNGEALALRDRLARQVLDPSSWPPFDIQAAQVSGSAQARLFVCFDNLMLDGLSMQILLAELELLYVNPEQTLPELEIGFRDYLEYIRHADINADSVAYWERRLETLPPAPSLPMRCDPAKVDIPSFSRLSAELSPSQWALLKARARDEGLTPSAILLSAFATCLSVWANQNELCLNLTLFDRQPLHPQIESVLGDFTTLLLLAWQPANNWRRSAHGLQKRLRQDLLHRDVSAIQVMRHLAQRSDRAVVSMPVVFTSALGFKNDRFLAHDAWMIPRWGVSQTPQVWLDHQVYESEGELRFNWDYVQELFDQKQITTMFERYVALLRRLAVDNDAWNKPPGELVPKLEGILIAPLNSAITPSEPTNTMTSTTKTLGIDDPMVDMLCQCFKYVVEQPISPRQSFFDAGATSLKLIKMHVYLTQNGYAGLEVTDLFAHASPLSLAAHLYSQSNQTNNKIRIDDAHRELLSQRKIRAQRRREGRYEY